MDKDKNQSEEEEDLPEIKVDILGHPILPACQAVHLKSRQDIIHDIFTKAYSKFYFYDCL